MLSLPSLTANTFPVDAPGTYSPARTSRPSSVATSNFERSQNALAFTENFTELWYTVTAVSIDAVAGSFRRLIHTVHALFSREINSIYRLRYNYCYCYYNYCYLIAGNDADFRLWRWTPPPRAVTVAIVTRNANDTSESRPAFHRDTRRTVLLSTSSLRSHVPGPVAHTHTHTHFGDYYPRLALDISFEPTETRYFYRQRRRRRRIVRLLYVSYCIVHVFTRGLRVGRTRSQALCPENISPVICLTSVKYAVLGDPARLYSNDSVFVIHTHACTYTYRSVTRRSRENRSCVIRRVRLLKVFINVYLRPTALYDQFSGPCQCV